MIQVVESETGRGGVLSRTGKRRRRVCAKPTYPTPRSYVYECRKSDWGSTEALAKIG